MPEQVVRPYWPVSDLMGLSSDRSTHSYDWIGST